METFSFALKDLERLAAWAMLEALRSPLSSAALNPFLASLAAALDAALNKDVNDDQQPPKYDGRLETLTDKQVSEVIGTFNVFYLAFKELRQDNAVKFCEQVREIAAAELLARLSRRNPAGRFFPEAN